MGIEAVTVDLFLQYTSPAQLPTDEQHLDNLVRMAVGVLGNPNWVEPAKRILRDVNPRVSGRYLVGALSDSLSHDAARDMLAHYGASRGTIGPLVNALINERAADTAVQLLTGYGPSKQMIGLLVHALHDERSASHAGHLLSGYEKNPYAQEYLVAALVHPDTAFRARDILMQYHPTGKLVRYLLTALSDPASAEHTRTIFAHYKQYPETVGLVISFLTNLECGPQVQEALTGYDSKSRFILRKALTGMLENPDQQGRIAAVVQRFEMTTSLSNMLVDLLHNDTGRKAAIQLFEHFGPNRYTAGRLVSALRDESIRPIASRLLKQYGPHETTVWPLVAALQHIEAGQRDTIMDILDCYGPSELTRTMLSQALSDPERAEPARAVLARYDAIPSSPKAETF
ncbi:hypothetical protein HYU22_03505 [Candidatus Woesearchaeota archaeon]|nr:hypothetical protein [Candidatus Woesearchaeota archaeon]